MLFRSRAGQSPWSFYGGHGLALIGVLIIAHLAARFGGLPANAGGTLMIVMALAYAAVAIRSAARRRPRRFTSEAIPSDMLP